MQAHSQRAQKSTAWTPEVRSKVSAGGRDLSSQHMAAHQSKPWYRFGARLLFPPPPLKRVPGTQGMPAYAQYIICVPT